MCVCVGGCSLPSMIFPHLYSGLDLPIGSQEH